MKLSESMKGNKNPLYGKHHTEETRQKMSESRTGERNHNYGKTFSEEHRRKLSESKSKLVRCVETNIIYCGIKNASNQTGVDKTGIHKCCKGKQKTSGGYHWEYVDD